MCVRQRPASRDWKDSIGHNGSTSRFWYIVGIRTYGKLSTRDNELYYWPRDRIVLTPPAVGLFSGLQIAKLYVLLQRPAPFPHVYLISNTLELLRKRTNRALPSRLHQLTPTHINNFQLRAINWLFTDTVVLDFEDETTVGVMVKKRWGQNEVWKVTGRVSRYCRCFHGS